MNENKIIFAKVKDSAIIPSKEQENAGYDIYACWEGITKKDKIIKPHSTKLIPTGIACALPIDYYFQVEERGSTGSKGIKKSAGVIDSGYRGEIFIAISNINDKHLIFSNKTKDEYLVDALNDLKTWQNVDVNYLTEQDKSDADIYLKDNCGSSYTSLSNEEKEREIINLYTKVKEAHFEEDLINTINNAIFYPENKAIAQLVLHNIEDLPIEEISFDELQKIPSKRGDKKLGSSGK